MMLDKKVAIIGLGVMGQSIMEGFVKSGLLNWGSLMATTIPEMMNSLKKTYPELMLSVSNDTAIAWADVIIFCLKPKILLELLADESLKSVLQRDKVFISIAAGVTLEQLGAAIKRPANLIRVMPNVAARVQSSMNVICPAPSGCTPEALSICKELFKTSGRCVELPESQFDVATAICGSGPALFCMIIEAMTAGGLKMGLPSSVAAELATQTMAGTAKMILEGDDHPAVLRDQVTTPGGCTIDGLAALEDGNLRATIANAIEKCTLKATSMSCKK